MRARPCLVLVSLLAFAPACLRASDGCPIDPVLDARREECKTAATELGCRYLASAEALARHDEGESSRILEEGLSHLGSDTVTDLVPRLQLYSLALIKPKNEDDACLTKARPMLVKLFATSLRQSVDGSSPSGSVLFFAPMFFRLTEKQVEKVEAKVEPPELAAKIKAAREEFVALLKKTETGKRLLSGEAVAVALELFQRGALGGGVPNPQDLLDLLPFGGGGALPFGGGDSAKLRPSDLGSLVEDLLRGSLDAKKLGRFEDAAVRALRGEKAAGLLPDDRRSRLLRWLGRKVGKEIAQRLGQRASDALEERLPQGAARDLAISLLQPGFDARNSAEAASRTLDALVEHLPEIADPANRQELEDLYRLAGRLLRVDDFDFTATPAQTETANRRMSSQISGMECVLSGDFACAAKHVETLARQTLAPGDRELREIDAAFLAWRGGDRRPEVLARAREALGRFERFVDEQFRLESTMIGYLDGDVRRAFQEVVGMAIDAGDAATALADAERGRSWALRRRLADRRQPGADREYAEALRRGSLQVDQLRSSGGGALEESQQRLEDSPYAQRLEHPERYRLDRADAADLEAVQRSLTDRQTLLAYFHADDDRWLIWRIEAASLRHAEVAIDAERWAWLDCFQAAAAAGTLGATRGAQHLGPACGREEDGWRELYALLIAPVAGEDQPPLRAELVVVPNGRLHLLAFAALADPRGERLVARHRLSLAPSLSLWLRSVDRERSGTPAEPGEALVLGDPTGADLPGAAEEARLVAKRFATEAFLGADATESLVYDRTPGPALVHLAAHAAYDRDFPRQSGIRLSPSTGIAAQDGRLTALEVEELLDLRGTALVTLSACETGLGELSQGDEVIGLTRAFLIAGSRAVLSTLWRVDDRASQRLMQGFYQRLAIGAPVAEALQQAQLELAASSDTADPHYWAGFVLTGDPSARLPYSTTTSTGKRSIDQALGAIDGGLRRPS